MIVASAVAAHRSGQRNTVKQRRTQSLHDQLLGDHVVGETLDEEYVRQHALARQAASKSLLDKRDPKHLKSGVLSKLTSAGMWIEKAVTVSQTQVSISESQTGAEFQDYILLHEIDKIDFSPLSGDGATNIERVTSEDGDTSRQRQRSLIPNFRRLSGGLLSTVFDSSTAIRFAAFSIYTAAGGSNAGRIYTFKAASPTEAQQWISFLTTQSKLRAKEMQRKSLFQLWQTRASRLYHHGITQGLVALLISINFTINAYQCEYHPQTLKSKDAEGARTYMLLDVLLTSIFVAELVFNAFAHWFWQFWLDGWNLFDFIIVTLSLVSVMVPSIPGLSFLRVLRAFRVLRLIRRFQSLKQIFDALILSVIPVLNAFVIAVLITFIYTILGVFLFLDQSPDNFGTFSRSLMTLFMLVALGQWPEEELAVLDEDGLVDKAVLAFLFSFIAVVLWTCLQVVVAVLLDNFLSATQEKKRTDAIQYQKAIRRDGSPLDPLLKKLTDDFDTEEDLHRDILAVFQILDIDDSGTLSDKEMVEGFGKLKLSPKIQITADDCTALKIRLLGCPADQQLSAESFEELVMLLLRSFLQRQMHDAFAINQGDTATTALLGALKVMLMPEREHRRAAPPPSHPEGKEDEAADAGRRFLEMRFLEMQMEELRGEMHSLPERIVAALMQPQPLVSAGTKHDRPADAGLLSDTLIPKSSSGKLHATHVKPLPVVTAAQRDSRTVHSWLQRHPEKPAAVPGDKPPGMRQGPKSVLRSPFEVVDTQWLQMAHARNFECKSATIGHIQEPTSFDGRILAADFVRSPE